MSTRVKHERDRQQLGELADCREEVARLKEMVHKDDLTGLFNFRHFSMVMEQELERVRRTGQPLSLIMMDLDHFKQVNDTWGHETGNLVLRQTAESVVQVLRRVDIPCRYGGEEFALILPETQLPRAVTAANRLCDVIRNTPIETPDARFQITASMGVDVYRRGDNMTLDGFVQSADSFLYRAKKEGRDQVCHRDFEQIKPRSQVGGDEKAALFGDPEEG